MDSNTPWLDLDAAAEYCHKGRRFVLSQINAGHLRAARIGGKRQVLTRREWIDEWIEAQAAPVMIPVRRRA